MMQKVILLSAALILLTWILIKQTDEQPPSPLESVEQAVIVSSEKQVENDQLISNASHIDKPSVEQAKPQASHPTSNNTQAVEQTIEALAEVQWQAYIDQDSTLYQQLLTQSEQAVGIPVVIGEDIYFRLDIEGQIEFSKLNKNDGEMILEEPYKVYNKLQQSLNENDGLGDWSQDPEQSIRDIFSQFYRFGSYSILSLQCRQNACLVEFDFGSIQHAEQFVKYLRHNRSQCGCIPMEILWPEQHRGVIRFEMI